MVACRCISRRIHPVLLLRLPLVFGRDEVFTALDAGCYDIACWWNFDAVRAVYGYGCSLEPNFTIFNS